MNEHLNPAVYGHYAALINHPAYYYLYGLYADYQVNNAFILPREHQEQVREKLRTIQSLLWYFRPYRKSHSLRLFTERESMARFPAHLVSEAWSELHEFIAQMGPPPGWSESPREARPRRGGRPRHSARTGALPAPVEPPTPGEQPPEKPQEQPPERPRSPIDYKRKV